MTAAAIFIAGLALLALIAIARPILRRLKYRRRMRMGPLPIWLNISRSPSKGWTASWTIKFLGWHWNSRTHHQGVDLPGDWSMDTTPRSRRRRASSKDN